MKKTARILMCLALVAACLMTIFSVCAKDYEFNTNGVLEISGNSVNSTIYTCKSQNHHPPFIY